MGGDQDRLVLELRFCSQLMIERFCPVADLLDRLSVSRRAEVERISVKIVEVFRRNLKIVCPASKPFPGAKGKLHQAVVGRKRHISARKDELCRVLCAAQWTGNSKVKRDIFQSFRRHFRQTDTILIQLGVRLALQSAFYVPRSFTVAYDIKFHKNQPLSSMLNSFCSFLQIFSTNFCTFSKSNASSFGAKVTVNAMLFFPSGIWPPS